MMVAPTRSPIVVISDWLQLIQVGQWTPMEAAREVLGRLKQEGYSIVMTDDIEEIRTDLQHLPNRIVDKINRLRGI
jgi:hypothetical protein